MIFICYLKSGPCKSGIGGWSAAAAVVLFKLISLSSTWPAFLWNWLSRESISNLERVSLKCSSVLKACSQVRLAVEQVWTCHQPKACQGEILPVNCPGFSLSQELSSPDQSAELKQQSRAIQWQIPRFPGGTQLSALFKVTTHRKESVADTSLECYLRSHFYNKWVISSSMSTTWKNTPLITLVFCS